jgi:hypothetical protein
VLSYCAGTWERLLVTVPLPERSPGRSARSSCWVTVPLPERGTVSTMDSVTTKCNQYAFELQRAFEQLQKIHEKTHGDVVNYQSGVCGSAP